MLNQTTPRDQAAHECISRWRRRAMRAVRTAPPSTTAHQATYSRPAHCFDSTRQSPNYGAFQSSNFDLTGPDFVSIVEHATYRTCVLDREECPMRNGQTGAANSVRYRELPCGQAKAFAASVLEETIQDIAAFVVVCVFWGLIIAAAISTTLH